MSKRYIYICILVFFSYIQLFSQSDYRVAQEFKSKLRSWDIAIEYAKTSEELDNIRKEILAFKDEYKDKKELLDNALYPKNFNSSFKKILAKIEYANKNLSKITTLSKQVTKVEAKNKSLTKSLKKINLELNALRKNNSRLLRELKIFRAGYGYSKNELDSLRNLVNEFKLGIAKRDTLISEIMNNIFADVSHQIETLDDAEKKSIKANVKNTNLIDNISKLIKDNKDFIDASLFTKDDLLQLRNEYDSFNRQWSFFGPKLFNVYSTDTVNRVKLFEVDGLLFKWDSALNEALWKTIHQGFKERGEDIDYFTNGIEFEENVIKYIENKIDTGSKEKYEYFKEKVWDNFFKKEWLPLIKEQELLTTEQLQKIENKLDDWGSNSNNYISILLYVIIFIFVIAILFVIFKITNNKKTKASSNNKLVNDAQQEEKKDKEDFGSNKKL
ncbi:MAG: hypothetical protein CR986_03490 [Ignavibacteriae bacterium]|nr:MAG: hypothetical protein CR986_03490 [Ignavibacteriota bacterium]